MEIENKRKENEIQTTLKKKIEKLQQQQVNFDQQSKSQEISHGQKVKTLQSKIDELTKVIDKLETSEKTERASSKAKKAALLKSLEDKASAVIKHKEELKTLKAAHYKRLLTLSVKKMRQHHMLASFNCWKSTFLSAKRAKNILHKYFRKLSHHQVRAGFRTWLEYHKLNYFHEQLKQVQNRHIEMASKQCDEAVSVAVSSLKEEHRLAIDRLANDMEIENKRKENEMLKKMQLNFEADLRRIEKDSKQNVQKHTLGETNNSKLSSIQVEHERAISKKEEELERIKKKSKQDFDDFCRKKDLQLVEQLHKATAEFEKAREAEVDKIKKAAAESIKSATNTVKLHYETKLKDLTLQHQKELELAQLKNESTIEELPYQGSELLKTTDNRMEQAHLKELNRMRLEYETNIQQTKVEANSSIIAAKTNIDRLENLLEISHTKIASMSAKMKHLTSSNLLLNEKEKSNQEQLENVQNKWSKTKRELIRAQQELDKALEQHVSSTLSHETATQHINSQWKQKIRAIQLHSDEISQTNKAEITRLTRTLEKTTREKCALLDEFSQVQMTIQIKQHELSEALNRLHSEREAHKTAIQEIESQWKRKIKAMQLHADEISQTNNLEITSLNRTLEKRFREKCALLDENNRLQDQVKKSHLHAQAAEMAKQQAWDDLNRNAGLRQTLLQKDYTNMQNMTASMHASINNIVESSVSAISQTHHAQLEAIQSTHAIILKHRVAEYETNECRLRKIIENDAASLAQCKKQVDDLSISLKKTKFNYEQLKNEYHQMLASHMQTLNGFKLSLKSIIVNKIQCQEKQLIDISKELLSLRAQVIQLKEHSITQEVQYQQQLQQLKPVISPSTMDSSMLSGSYNSEYLWKQKSEVIDTPGPMSSFSSPEKVSMLPQLSPSPSPSPSSSDEDDYEDALAPDEEYNNQYKAMESEQKSSIIIYEQDERMRLRNKIVAITARKWRDENVQLRSEIKSLRFDFEQLEQEQNDLMKKLEEDQLLEHDNLQLMDRLESLKENQSDLTLIQTLNDTTNDLLVKLQRLKSNRKHD